MSDFDLNFDEELAKLNQIKREQSKQEYDSGIDDFFSSDFGSSGGDSYNSNLGGGFSDPYSSGMSTGFGDLYGASYGNSYGMGSPQPPKESAKEQFGQLMVDTVKKYPIFLKFLGDIYTIFRDVIENPLHRKSFLTRFSIYCLTALGVQVLITTVARGILNSFLYTSLVFTGIAVSSYVFNFLFFMNTYLDIDGSDQVDENNIFDNRQVDDTGFDSFDEFDTSSSYTDNGFDSFEDYDYSDDYDDSEDYEDSYDDSYDYDDDDYDDDYADEDLISLDDLIPDADSDVKEVTEEHLKQIVEEVKNVPKELVTRSLLLDKYLSMLDSGGLNISKVTEFDVDDDVAIQFTAGFNEAQRACRIAQEDYSDIISIKQCFMTWELSFTKSNMSTAQVTKVGEEFNILLQTDYKKQFGEDVYCTIKSVGARVDVVIFMGTPAVAFLKDMIEAKKDFFLDSKNELPVVLGYNEKGEIIVTDLVRENNVLISGKARSGKSNLSKVLIDQLIALNSPKKVNLMFGDVKSRVSDWSHFQTPHVKRVEYNPQSIVDMLDWVINEEAPRREKTIAQVGGALKIQTYNEHNPDNPIPYLYIVLDEMLAFSEEATQEQSSAYRSHLSVIASKLPAYGIFIIAIPHYISDKVIKKGVSRLISLKIAVKNTPQELEDVFKKDAKNFEYILKNQGDFAYISGNSNKMNYCHAPLLMKGDTGVYRLGKAQKEMWEALAPDEYITSYAGRMEHVKKQKELMEKAFGHDDSFIDFDD